MIDCQAVPSKEIMKYTDSRKRETIQLKTELESVLTGMGMETRMCIGARTSQSGFARHSSLPASTSLRHQTCHLAPPGFRRHLFRLVIGGLMSGSRATSAARHGVRTAQVSVLHSRGLY
jgi:hypothetical protein